MSIDFKTQGSSTNRVLNEVSKDTWSKIKRSDTSLTEKLLKY